MTTINNSHFIEKVGGIEKAREIVSGAPKGFDAYSFKEKKYVRSDWFLGEVSLNDLRTAIEHHYYGRSEAEELAAYAELSQEKIEGGAMLVGDFSDTRKIIDKQLESDHITDIRNHISPNTKVVEL